MNNFSDLPVVTAEKFDSVSRAVENATDNLFANLSTIFPEIQHGDMNTDQMDALEKSLLTAAYQWIENNMPEK